MKPFAVRLAAGAVTILLGAIMAAQAQKDHHNELISAWNPTMDLEQLTPAPIAAGGGLLENETSVPSPFADVADAIQLVQHTEPAPQANTFAIPDNLTMGGADPLAAVAEAVQGSSPMPALNLPPAMAGTVADLKEDVAAAVRMPNVRIPDVAMPEVAMPEVAMPAVAMPQQIASGIRGAVSDVATTAGEVLADTLPSNDLRPGQATLPAMPLPANQDSTPMIRDVVRPQAPPMQAPPMQAPPMHVPEMPNHQMNDVPANQARMAQPLPLRQDQQPYVDQRMNNGMPATNLRGLSPEPLRQAESSFADQRAPLRQNSAPALRQNSAPALRDDYRQDNRMMDNALPRNPLPRNDFPGRMASAALNQGGGISGNATGLGQPGDRRLEGAQSPSVVIHKRAPREVKVGKPASFVIQVQNVGSAEALNVQVMDMIPAGMVFRDATPKPAGTGANGEYVWQLGNLSAGEERTVTMELVPQSEGELGSVARVTFEAAASVRTMSTRPELKIVQKAPKTVPVGQQLEIEVEVSNPGTGDATGVILQEDVPDGLEHPQGRQLDNLIGTLRPGEVRRQMLRLRAVAPGVVRNAIRLKADDGLTANHVVDVQVIAPDLQVVLNGPARRYLERQAQFDLSVINAGTDDATNVDITAFLDRGFRFVSTGNQGQYDQSRHAVVWRLDQLRPNSKGTIPLTLLPVQEGTRAIQLEAKADFGAIAKNEHSVAVDALAELTFSINDSADPIEVGTETTYEVKVTNSGSRPDTNVQLQLTFPAGMEVVSADGAQQQRPGVILFNPRARLDANGEMVYRVKAMGRQQGTHLIKAVVVSDQSPVQVTKEESTMVYNDQGTIATRPAGFRR